MRSLCREFGQQNGVEVDFKSDFLLSVVPPRTSLCLFRVLQEALRNAVKHSGARKFDVQLKETADEIHLETVKASKGLGLNHMAERLKLVKGSLSIDSQPMRGTAIRARVPLLLFESESQMPN
jgi:signal transduction histidine kinase